jgi:hypothetical protein
VAKIPGVFHPTWTEPGPGGSRVRRTSAKWAYRFEHRGRLYQAADFETQAAASRARDARRAEVQAGLTDDWRKLTLDQCRLARLDRGLDWAKTTQANFRGAWLRLFRHFAPSDPAHEVDAGRILRYQRFARERGDAKNTVTLDLVQLRAALRLGHEELGLPRVPKFPKVEWQAREQTIAPVQLDQILAKMPAWWRLYFETAQELGWRAASEVRTRQWSHVDWGPDVWTCCAGKLSADACACGAGRPGWLQLEAEASKTRKPRLFPMTRKLREILTRARMRCDEVQRRAGKILPWIFVRDDGGQVGDAGPDWRAALELLGVAPLSSTGKPWSSAMVPHDIRRSWIRRQKRAGLERDARKRLVGHSTDAAHQHYEAKGPDLDELRAAALEMDRQAGESTADNVVQLSLWRPAR